MSLMLGRYTHINIWSSIWAIQEYEGVQVHVRAWYLIYYSSNKPGGLRVKNTCNIEVHSCKQLLYFLSLPLDNKSFSGRPGVKCKLGAKCKTGTANWGRNVDWVKTVLTIEFKREWGKKNENIQFTLYTLYMELDPNILWRQCAWLTNMIIISTFSERQYSSAYDEKSAVQVILIITIQYTWIIGKTLPGLCLIKSCWPKILF